MIDRTTCTGYPISIVPLTGLAINPGKYVPMFNFPAHEKHQHHWRPHTLGTLLKREPPKFPKLLGNVRKYANTRIFYDFQLRKISYRHFAESFSFFFKLYFILYHSLVFGFRFIRNENLLINTQLVCFWQMVWPCGIPDSSIFVRLSVLLYYSGNRLRRKRLSRKNG